MTDPNWQALGEVTVAAKPAHGFWTRALDYVDGSQRLKFVADDIRPSPAASEGQLGAAPDKNVWMYAPRNPCSADGEPTAPINPANCLMADIPAGALIAKIGGSTAGKADGVKTFAVGSFCVIELDATTRGPLYLTMNADPMSPLERNGTLLVKLFYSR